MNKITNDLENYDKKKKEEKNRMDLDRVSTRWCEGTLGTNVFGRRGWEKEFRKSDVQIINNRNLYFFFFFYQIRNSQNRMTK